MGRKDDVLTKVNLITVAGTVAKLAAVAGGALAGLFGGRANDLPVGGVGGGGSTCGAPSEKVRFAGLSGRLDGRHQQGLERGVTSSPGVGETGVPGSVTHEHTQGSRRHRSRVAIGA